jgi:hypothetical protein
MRALNETNVALQEPPSQAWTNKMKLWMPRSTNWKAINIIALEAEQKQPTISTKPKHS